MTRLLTKRKTIEINSSSKTLVVIFLEIYRDSRLPPPRTRDFPESVEKKEKSTERNEPETNTLELRTSTSCFGRMCYLSDVLIFA